MFLYRLPGTPDLRNSCLLIVTVFATIESHPIVMENV